MREGNIQVHSENILPIIKKWLYSDKDIFLRELISNACDAVYKLNRLAAMGEFSGETQGRIDVFLDKEARTLTVSDNGIGMTEEEVEKYITQVAFSGAAEFLEKYKEQSAEGEGGIIGHFGLGFYSAFMVSDTVEINTLSHKEGAAAVLWRSKGEAAYEIGPGERDGHGTSITLNINEDESEFLEEFRIREMLRKYCMFMPVPIYFNTAEGIAEAAKKAEEAAKEADEKSEEDAVEKSDEAVETPAEKPFNNPEPLWQKAPKDCTKEEYEQLYRELFMDFNPPLFWIHLNVDYPFNLKGILYFPKQTDKMEVMPGEIKLYSNQVYIADNIKEVVPEFLMLLKGAIDCPDLPLNVSRSFLQNDGDVAKISKHISKKVSDKLHEIFDTDRSAYEGYWEDIAPFIKFGCLKDEAFYDRVKDILLLKSTGGKYFTLTEYPKTESGKIFYASDEVVQAQYIRLFGEQDMTAALLNHMIDPHFISFIEYKDKDIKFARIDSEVESELKSGDAGEDSEEIIEKFKAAVGNEKLTVRAERLKNAGAPAIMLLSEEARRMQEMSKMYGGMFGGGAPEETVVLNLENPAVKSIPALPEDKAALICAQILDLARISHKPLEAGEMADFLSRSARLLEELTKAE